MNNKNEKLKIIQNNLKSQNNRLTEQPIFIVQQIVRDYGFCSDYSDTYVWINEEGEELSEEDYDLLDSKEENGEDIDPFKKVYYRDRYEFVTTCFTEQGCKDYLKINGHNLNNPRIYAEGSFRNEEFRIIRKFLMNFGE